jgi:hypothetical protein
LPTPFDAILNQSRDLFAERLGEGMSAMLDKADEALSAYVEKEKDKDAQGYLQLARDVVSRNRVDIEGEFSRRYLEEFAKRVREVKKALGTPSEELEEDPLEMELELVGEEDLDETLKFNDMAARLRRICDQELGALDQRAAVILGDANLQAEQNPFGAQAICGAYKHVCKGIESDPKIRRVLLKLFDDHFADKVRGMYKEVNELLVDNSILPKIKFAVKKTEGGAAGADDEDDEGDVDDAVEAKVRKATDAAAAAGQDIFQILAKLVGPQTGPGGAPLPGTPGGPPALEGTALLTSLSQLQHGNLGVITAGSVAIAQGDPGAVNVLAQLKETNVGASMGQMDAMTLDIVSMLFDQIFDDPKVPAGVKALVGRLQIPILKIAIADKTVFSKKDHPARVMLDIIGDFAGRLPADFDKEHPMYPKLDAVLHELIEKYDDKVESFIAVNEKLQALAAEEDAREKSEVDAVAKDVEKREKLALARNAAQEAIKERFDEEKVPRAVLDFLLRHWVKHLLVTHLQGGIQSDGWKSAVDTMDLLIWSVHPKTDTLQRKKLASSVPTLLKNLTKGMQAAGVEDTARTAFFAELMKLHTAVLKTGGDIIDDVKQAAKDAKPKPAPGTKEAILAAMEKAAEPAKSPAEELDFTAPIAVKIGNEVVQVEKSDQLDFTAAAEAAAPAAEAAPGAAAKPGAAGSAGAKPVVAREPPKEVKLPSKLKEGVWVGIRGKGPDDPRQPAKLLYVSPLKSRFLFADKQGKTVLECTRVELAKRFKLRDLVILAENPDASLFERIINGVMGKLGHA